MPFCLQITVKQHYPILFYSILFLGTWTLYEDKVLLSIEVNEAEGETV